MIEVDPDWWKHLFDEVYLCTDARTVCDREVTGREVDVVSEILSLRCDDRILDLCGGHGRHSIELGRRGFGGCTVLDFSPVLIERGRAEAREQGLEIDFIRGDACDTGLPVESFDHVLILGNSLGYLPEADDDLRIMKEACRLLKPGGCLLADITDGDLIRRSFNPNAWHEIDGDIVVCRQREIDGRCVRARELVLSKEEGLIRDSTYAIRIYEPDGMVQLMEEAGFGGVAVHRNFSPRTGRGDCGFMNHRVLVSGRKDER